MSKRRNGISRRDTLKLLGTGATAFAPPAWAFAKAGAQPPAVPPDSPQGGPGFNTPDNRPERMKWWHAAKFGMFIHWGLYSVVGRHEWAMEMEGIPVAEYMELEKRFKPVPNAARAWARLAKKAGQKYMVMTSKHHEGFCNFDTQLTNYCAPKQGPGRDLVKEFVAAARAEGLRVGLYYSLMDWHHPDGAKCATNEEARRRFVAYTHGLIRDILTNFGTIDVLWYDVAWPLDAQGWESEKMNRMVFELQPKIIVNNRNKLEGDFSTPEQRIEAAKAGRAWEACMTMNDSWGYQRADDDWKSPKTIVRNIATAAQGGGNYLLNIGPKGDGSIPEESVRILTRVGQWMDKHGSTIYESEPCQVTRSTFAKFTRKGNTLYAHVHFWPGSTFGIGGLRTKVQSAKILTTGQKAEFQQDDFRVKFTRLPEKAPDELATVIALECESEPIQDMLNVRENRPRDGV